MKKNKIVKFVIILICIAGCFLYRQTKVQQEMGNIIIDNIEALAAGEDTDAPTYCYGTGDIDCHGIKVKKTIDYRLDIE